MNTDDRLAAWGHSRLKAEFPDSVFSAVQVRYAVETGLEGCETCGPDPSECFLTIVGRRKGKRSIVRRVSLGEGGLWGIKEFKKVMGEMADVTEADLC